MQAHQIVVLGTGGTIAGRGERAGEALGYRAGEIGIQQLIAGVPVPEGVTLAGEQLAQVDSKDMAFAVWQRLAARCRLALEQAQVRGIVVTHGTDTLEETAWFLQRVLAPRKPIALASAMRPATALVPDGPQNLADALVVASAPGAQGVVAVCAGVVHGAADVRKVHPYRLDAFGSGDAGPVGYVEAGRLRQVRPWPPSEPVAGLADRVAGTERWPWVEIVHSHAGADARAVQALVDAGVQGLVVAATGNGTVHAALEPALARAMQAGVRVVRASRCLEAPVLAQPQDAIPAAGLTPAKARVELLLSLLA